MRWVLLAGLVACTETSTGLPPVGAPGDDPVVDHHHGGGTEDPTQYCITHADCPSNACADNVCLRAGQVAYVADGGEGDLCTQTRPCGSVALGLSTRREVVKVAGAHDEAVTVDHRAVTILGDAARLASLHVGDGATVVVRDLALRAVEMAAPESASVLELDRCSVVDGTGIRTEGDAHLVVSRTLIAGNTAGLQARGSVDVTSSVIARNTGVGAAIESGRFAFNTIVDNGVGIACGEGSLPNNIVARNGIALDGPCTLPTSLVQADLTGLQLAHPDDEPFDYHLTPGSSALDAAAFDAGAHPMVDIDGEPRGPAPDIGADELR